jgi:hypothetical protein
MRLTLRSPAAIAACLVGTVAAFAFCAAAVGAAAPSPTRADLEKRFSSTVKPFLATYCVTCHGKEKPQSQLDLSGYGTMASVAADYPHWALVLERLLAKQMPPTGAKQPPSQQRTALINWIRAVRTYEASRNAGDPGLVLARRLSNAEYDYSIRDLTGVDLRPTREFPVDPANQEGFDNSGESLTVSPALMKKYLQAARQVSDHMVLNPTGIAFAPHPVLAETDRDKYGVLRIVDFYKRQPTDLAEYFYASWRYRQRAALGIPQATLASIAAQMSISPRYLDLVWRTLNEAPTTVGPMAELQKLWNVLPQGADPDKAREACGEMRDRVQALRKKLAWRFTNLRLPRGFSPGGQAFIMWKNRQYASHRRKLDESRLQVGGVPKTRTIYPSRGNGGRADPPQMVTDAVDPDLFVPAEEAARAPYLASFNRFCDVFPDAFYISERGRMHIDDPNDKGRFLSAGLHNSMGYFRDDTPLMELILDDQGRAELERLWLDFHFVAFIPERMHLEFIFYERAESHTITDSEFDFARSEDKDATSDAKVKRLGDAYLAKARRNMDSGVREVDAQVIPAIEEHFRITTSTIRAIERARSEARVRHLPALLEFARRAYRRPLTQPERDGLALFYKTLREKDGLSHEEAIRDGIVSVLMSPNFLFRLDLEATSAAPTPPYPQAPTLPLSDYALASRLSYFLWSSLPDDELLARAAAGDLHKPGVLAAQARRMLKDPRVRALALEFGGNWLDFRRFEEHNAVDRQRFPAFDDALRTAMFEEPVRFLVDQFQNDRPVLDMLYGKHTFVNAALAKHYGMKDLTPVGWVRVDDAERYGRGGLLPMAAFLTRNSPGLRTSPVKRGYWLVRRVLGEHIPPPPPTVPELPQDEGKLGDLTLRQLLEKHRDHPACSGCHARFDSFGLVFENYGPVGEMREKDLGGKPVDTRAEFPGGSEHSGLAGLQTYLRSQRQNDFLDTLSRKLLSYALGRTLQPSDDGTLAQMRQRLTPGGNRFGALVEAIVTSRQFRNRRVSRMAPTTKTGAGIQRSARSF